MSAVFTGNGLGLFNTSLNQLGGGLGGQARVGQGGEQQFVNLATGNLVWQGQDEHLTFRGLDVPPVLSSTANWSPIPPDQEIGREETLFRRTDHRLPA